MQKLLRSFAVPFLYGLRQGFFFVFLPLKDFFREDIPIPFEFFYVCPFRERGNPAIQPENFKPDWYKFRNPCNMNKNFEEPIISRRL